MSPPIKYNDLKDLPPIKKRNPNMDSESSSNRPNIYVDERRFRSKRQAQDAPANAQQPDLKRTKRSGSTTAATRATNQKASTKTDKKMKAATTSKSKTTEDTVASDSGSSPLMPRRRGVADVRQRSRQVIDEDDEDDDLPIPQKKGDSKTQKQTAQAPEKESREAYKKRIADAAKQTGLDVKKNTLTAGSKDTSSKAGKTTSTAGSKQKSADNSKKPTPGAAKSDANATNNESSIQAGNQISTDAGKNEGNVRRPKRKRVVYSSDEDESPPVKKNTATQKNVSAVSKDGLAEKKGLAQKDDTDAEKVDGAQKDSADAKKADVTAQKDGIVKKDDAGKKTGTSGNGSNKAKNNPRSNPLRPNTKGNRITKPRKTFEQWAKDTVPVLRRRAISLGLVVKSSHRKPDIIDRIMQHYKDNPGIDESDAEDNNSAAKSTRNSNPKTNATTAGKASETSTQSLIDGLTYRQAQAACRGNRLPATGTKEELLSRLRRWQAKRDREQAAKDKARDAAAEKVKKRNEAAKAAKELKDKSSSNAATTEKNASKNSGPEKSKNASDNQSKIPATKKPQLAMSNLPSFKRRSQQPSAQVESQSATTPVQAGLPGHTAIGDAGIQLQHSVPSPVESQSTGGEKSASKLSSKAVDAVKTTSEGLQSTVATSVQPVLATLPTPTQTDVTAPEVLQPVITADSQEERAEKAARDKMTAPKSTKAPEVPQFHQTSGAIEQSKESEQNPKLPVTQSVPTSGSSSDLTPSRPSAASPVQFSPILDSSPASFSRMSPSFNTPAAIAPATTRNTTSAAGNTAAATGNPSGTNGNTPAATGTTSQVDDQRRQAFQTQAEADRWARINALADELEEEEEEWYRQRKLPATNSSTANLLRTPRPMRDANHPLAPSVVDTVPTATGVTDKVADKEDEKEKEDVEMSDADDDSLEDDSLFRASDVTLGSFVAFPTSPTLPVSAGPGPVQVDDSFANDSLFAANRAPDVEFSSSVGSSSSPSLPVPAIQIQGPQSTEALDLNMGADGINGQDQINIGPSGAQLNLDATGGSDDWSAMDREIEDFYGASDDENEDEESSRKHQSPPFHQKSHPNIVQNRRIPGVSASALENQDEEYIPSPLTHELTIEELLRRQSLPYNPEFQDIQEYSPFDPLISPTSTSNAGKERNYTTGLTSNMTGDDTSGGNPVPPADDHSPFNTLFSHRNTSSNHVGKEQDGTGLIGNLANDVTFDESQVLPANHKLSTTTSTTTEQEYDPSGLTVGEDACEYDPFLPAAGLEIPTNSDILEHLLAQVGSYDDFEDVLVKEEEIEEFPFEERILSEREKAQEKKISERLAKQAAEDAEQAERDAEKQRLERQRERVKKWDKMHDTSGDLRRIVLDRREPLW